MDINEFIIPFALKSVAKAAKRHESKNRFF
ncbi:MAG: hypothetical protein RL329_1272 [Bacteroidota bacterium]|jgi:hypothetical protein